MSHWSPIDCFTHDMFTSSCSRKPLPPAHSYLFSRNQTVLSLFITTEGKMAEIGTKTCSFLKESFSAFPPSLFSRLGFCPSLTSGSGKQERMPPSPKKILVFFCNVNGNYWQTGWLKTRRVGVYRPLAESCTILVWIKTMLHCALHCWHVLYNCIVVPQERHVACQAETERDLHLQ